VTIEFFLDSLYPRTNHPHGYGSYGLLGVPPDPLGLQGGGHGDPPPPDEGGFTFSQFITESSSPTS
jgi:hypothetical protein